MWRACTQVRHCVFDQFPNLHNYVLDPGEVEAATWIDRQMAQVIATGQLLE